MTDQSSALTADDALARTLIIIPTYNERLNIERIVCDIMADIPSVHILIVDDASPDRTGDIADALASESARIHVLHRPGKAGLGRAYIAGFRWGLERDYDYLCEMDADGSHRPKDLQVMLQHREEAELVIGSRWVSGGSVVDWPWHRLMLSRAGNLYTRLMLGLQVQDATAGFRVFRRTLLERIALDDVASEGYCFQVDMTRRVAALKGTILEVPVRFVERKHGASKMSGAIVREALTRVTLWGIEARFAGVQHRLSRRRRD